LSRAKNSLRCFLLVLPFLIIFQNDTALFQYRHV
jgi:hypothetical protein